MLRQDLCEWCYLSDQINRILAEGQIDLTPLKDHLCAVRRPDSMIIWLYNDDVRTLLSSLANGTRPLTHSGLDDFPKRRVANHLRGLLVEVGMLDQRDEILAKFDRWVADRFPLAQTPEGAHLLEMFAKWYQRPALAAQPGTDSRMRGLCQEISVAARFLAHLHNKDETAANMTQATIDEWWATPPTTHRRCRPFLKWLLETHQVKTPITIPTVIDNVHPPLSQAGRIGHLTRMLDPNTGPLDARTAAILLLLLAQPFHKIIKLELVDITIGEETTIAIGTHPCPVPKPFAAVLQAQKTGNAGRNTATNATSRWLFPGRRPGHHLTASTMRNKVRNLGIDLRAARAATLASLVRGCPPAVVADMLDYHYNTVNKHAHRSGTTWARYPQLKSSGH